MDMEKNKYYRFCIAALMILAFVTLRGAFAQNDSPPEPASEKKINEEVIPVEKEPSGDSKEAVAVLIPCKGMIDDGLLESIKRRTEQALDLGATYLIYEIGTYGGLVKSADQISEYLILDVGKRADTVAYITTKAISAGAMISVACKDIIMLEHTTIGDCAPVTMGGELKGVEREKAESFIRATFSKAAQANDYPEPLLKAMVSQNIEVYRVKNNTTGRFEFFEKPDLPKDAQAYDLENKELVVSDKEILTLTAKEAEEYGVSRATVSNLDEAIGFLEGRDGVQFERDPVKLKLLWSEQMVRWINSPAVMSILILLAMLGAYIELNTPGLGLPGLVALICVIIIVGSKYLVGLANWVEVAVFALGVILLLVEIFIIPGFGVAGISGIICIFAGLFGMLVRNAPEEIPWPKSEFDWTLFMQGIFAMLAGLVGFIISVWLFAKFLPRIEFLSGLTLSPSADAARTKMTVPATGAPETGRPEIEVGMQGVVVSPLRPIGSARFGQMVVDVVARAEFLDKGQAVEIDEIHGNRVVVKKIQE